MKSLIVGRVPDIADDSSPATKKTVRNFVFIALLLSQWDCHHWPYKYESQLQFLIAKY